MSHPDGHTPRSMPETGQESGLDEAEQYLYTYHAGGNVLSPMEERMINLTARITVGVVVAWVALQEFVEEVSKYRSARRR